MSTLAKRLQNSWTPKKIKCLKTWQKKKVMVNILPNCFFWFHLKSFVISELFAETPLGIDPLKNAENIQGV